MRLNPWLAVSFAAILTTPPAIVAQAAELVPFDATPLDTGLNHQGLGEPQLAPSYGDDLGERSDDAFPSYEPDIGPFGRSIVGRAAVSGVPIRLEQPSPQNIQPNGSTCLVVLKDTIFGTSSSSSSRRRDVQDGGKHEDHERRATNKTIYLSSTTCLMPGLTDVNGKSKQAPQLQLLASTSESTGCPTSTNDVDDDMWVSFDEGMATLSFNVSDSPVYISVLAPNTSGQFSDIYNVEVAASTDSYYHSYDENSDSDKAVLWMDSDSSAALLVSRNLTLDPSKTQEIMNQSAPYELYVENDAYPSLKGMRRSLCAMQGQALISANRANTGRQNQLVHTTMTTRGTGGFPKQQFYFEGLNRTSVYTAILVQVSNSSGTVSGFDERQTSDANRRYTVFSPIQFRTLSGTTCKIITDLDFCTDTQYAVPGGGDKVNGSALATLYDNYARDMYGNFEKAMMQVACETDATSRYSLARGCDDCKEAYKRWLCNVAIPRCEDYTSSNEFAYERNVGQPFPNGTLLPESEREALSKTPGHNSSRNAFIDSAVSPGPYKEILPCEELCYEVVQSCPAVLGLGCPRPGMVGFEASYGQRLDDNSLVTCNYPGQPRTKVAGAVTLVPSLVTTILSVSVAVFALV